MELAKNLAQKHAQLMLDAERWIWKHPETGYKEWKTHEYLETEFAKLGYELTLAGDIPGFTAEIDTGRPGPKLAVFGELDSVICANHPEADPTTGAVHTCGHNCQAAALLGLAAMLKEPGALDGMCGKILLVAVPAEELLELEYREDLRKKGVIKYFGGKPEFLWRGLLDGVDMSFMIHTDNGDKSISGSSGGSNGCLLKNIRFEGKASHAGGSPHRGINALYAANLALSAINALRETFQDNSHIRVHPIITHGGDIVNAIPDNVTMECYVRGATMDDIVMVNKKVNRALAASAAAMGAKVHLRDIPGYYPRNYPAASFAMMQSAMEQVTDEVSIRPSGWGTGCSDMGDMCAVMPALHPYISGAIGTFHGADMYVTKPEIAVIQSAELQYVMLHTFLDDEAKNARELIDNYKPDFATYEEYFAFVDSLNLDIDAVSHEDGKTTLTYSATTEKAVEDATDEPL